MLNESCSINILEPLLCNHSLDAGKEVDEIGDKTEEEGNTPNAVRNMILFNSDKSYNYLLCGLFLVVSLCWGLLPLGCPWGGSGSRWPAHGKTVWSGILGLFVRGRGGI